MKAVGSYPVSAAEWTWPVNRSRLINRAPDFEEGWLPLPVRTTRVGSAIAVRTGVITRRGRLRRDSESFRPWRRQGSQAGVARLSLVALSGACATVITRRKSLRFLAIQRQKPRHVASAFCHNPRVGLSSLRGIK